MVEAVKLKAIEDVLLTPGTEPPVPDGAMLADVLSDAKSLVGTSVCGWPINRMTSAYSSSSSQMGRGLGSIVAQRFPAPRIPGRRRREHKGQSNSSTSYMKHHQ